MLSTRDFSTKVRAVARLLGMSFVFKHDLSSNTAMLHDESANLRLGVSNGDFRNRDTLLVYDFYPLDKFGANHHLWMSRVKIRMSEGKTPDQIASGIRRRFMPAYLENLCRVLNDNARMEALTAERNEGLVWIANVLGVKAKMERRGADTELNVRSRSTEPILPGLLSVAAEGGEGAGKFRLVLSVPVEEAVSVLETLRDVHARNSGRKKGETGRQGEVPGGSPAR